MELDLIAWFTDTRILGIVFCAAGIAVLRALSVPDDRRDHGKRGKIG